MVKRSDEVQSREGDAALLSALETVDLATFARLATSSSVAGRPLVFTEVDLAMWTKIRCLESAAA